MIYFVVNCHKETNGIFARWTIVELDALKGQHRAIENTVVERKPSIIFSIKP